MKTRRLIGVGTILSVTLLLALSPRVARSHDEHGHGGMEATTGHSHEMCELHGGSVTMTPANHFEVVFTKNEIRTYAYDEKQSPILNPAKATGRVMLQSKQGSPITLPLKYLPPDASKGRVQGYFAASHDFAGLAPGSMKATFHFEGISARPVDFRTPVALTELTQYSCPMHKDQTAADPINCPKCGMRMKKVGGSSDHKDMGSHASHSTPDHH